MTKDTTRGFAQDGLTTGHHSLPNIVTNGQTTSHLKEALGSVIKSPSSKGNGENGKQSGKEK